MSLKNWIALLTVSLGIAVAVTLAGPVRAQTLLKKGDIPKAFVAHTLKFPDYRTKKPVFIYFYEDGGYTMKFEGRTRTGKWWVGDDDTFCRVYSDGSRKQCLKASVAGNKVSFFRTDGRPAYKAELLPGNQMP